MLFAIAVASAATLHAILGMTRGHVLYTLDDPYIHLALAERLAGAGHYGINPGETAAPSSSILYPFLLAALLKAGLGQAASLIVCFCATLAAGAAFCAIAIEAGYTQGRFAGAAWAAALFVVTVTAAGNLIGLEFTGMEHSLHVALSLCCILGAMHFLRTERAAPWWLACTMIVPLVRYEGLSVWVATILLLAWHRRFVQAALVAAFGIVTIGGFSLWLHAHDLAWLPSSVLVKLGAADAATPAILPGQLALARVEAATLLIGGCAFLAAALYRAALLALAGGAVVYAAIAVSQSAFFAAGAPLQASLTAVQTVVHFAVRGVLTYGVVQLGMLALAMAGSLPASAKARDKRSLELAIFGLVIVLGHVAAGRFGWLSRYETYAVLSGAAVTAAVWARPAQAWLHRSGPIRQTMAAAGILAVMLLYGLRAVQAPATAAFVYTQQYQIHRLLTDIMPGPAAVNDLGLASYGNPNVVVDLWGLGSEPARKARLSNQGNAWMSGLADASHADVAIIYTDWFGKLPPDWHLAGSLSTAEPNYFDAESHMDIYATRDAARPVIRAALLRLSTTLPAADTLVVTPLSGTP